MALEKSLVDAEGARRSNALISQAKGQSLQYALNGRILLRLFFEAPAPEPNRELFLDLAFLFGFFTKLYLPCNTHKQTMEEIQHGSI